MQQEPPGTYSEDVQVHMPLLTDINSLELEDSTSTDNNWDHECVGDVCCILLHVPPGDVQTGAECSRREVTRRGPVCRIMDLHLLAGGQRIPLHRTSLFRQT